LLSTCENLRPPFFPVSNGLDRLDGAAGIAIDEEVVAVEPRLALRGRRL
jgi:hypothetical protein